VKVLIPLNGQLAAFPTQSYIGNPLIFLFSFVTFILYLVFQLVVFPFVFVNPTPFKKTNSLCQMYSFLGLKFNVAIFVLTFVTFIMKTYFPHYTYFVFIIFFLFMIYATKELITRQPYYNKYINDFRAGMWTMILGTTFVNFFSLLFGRGKSFFGIISLIMGILSFIGGIFLNRYMFKKHIEGIYKRFKEKRINDKMIYDYEHGIENNSNSDGSSNNSDNDSIDSSDKKKSKRNNKEDEEDEEEDDDDEYDSNSDKGSVVLTDRISERITSFSTIREIVKAKVLNEPIVVFKDFSDFELACRFIWSNETKEAFQLMKELYHEGLLQFPKVPFLYVYYAYYLLYIDSRMSKSDKDLIIGYKDMDYDDEEEEEEEKEEEDDDEERKEDDNEEKEIERVDDEKKNKELMDEEAINGNNPDYLLSKASSFKLNFFGKYFTRYLLDVIKENRKEDEDYYKKEAIENLIRLQHNAVEKHITLLNVLKKFFNNIKYISDHNKTESFNMERFLEVSYHLKNETLGYYHEIIEKYPDEKSTYQLYTLFMSDVMNQTDGDKNILNEADSYMALNEPTNRKTNLTKAKYKGSQSSVGQSVADGSGFGETEVKKKKILRENMMHSFTDKCNSIS